MKAINYGKLSLWDIYSGQINYVPLNLPDTVYGYVELNGMTDIKLLMEGENYNSIVEVNNDGEYTFYDVPTGESLCIYVLKAEKRSLKFRVVFKIHEGDCIYDIIDERYLEFEE